MEDKIWFLHLGETHEGPFTASEVAMKLDQGLAHAESLAWKHPMPDWLPLGKVPELAVLLKRKTSTVKTQAVASTAPDIAVAADDSATEESGFAGAGDGSMSLAARLAASQKSETNPLVMGNSADNLPNTDFGEERDTGVGLGMDSASAGSTEGLDFGANPENLATAAPGDYTTAEEAMDDDGPAVDYGTLPSGSGSLAVDPIEPQNFGQSEAAAPTSGTVTDDLVADTLASVWILRSGREVFGQYSLQELRSQYDTGDLAPGFELWRPGYSDFQDGATILEMVPESDQDADNTPRKSIFPSAPEGVDEDDFEETTRPRIAPVSAPNKYVEAIQNILSTISGLLKRFKKSKIVKSPGATTSEESSSILKHIGGGSPTVVSGAGKDRARGGSVGGGLRRVVLLLVLCVVLAGGAFVALSPGGAVPLPPFLKGLFSPLPDLPDVSEADYERLKQAAIASAEEGTKIELALSRENIFEPTYYIASNLPEGTSVKFKITAIPGKIVGRIQYQLELASVVTESKLAKIGPITEDNKPIPFGHYNLVLTADGTDAEIKQEIFIGPDGAPFERRMERFKERLQKDYDDDLVETRQTMETVVSLYKQVQARFAAITRPKAYNIDQQNALWKGFVAANLPIVEELTKKVQAHYTETDAEKKYKFFPYQYQQMSVFLDTVKKVLNDTRETFNVSKIVQIDKASAIIFYEVNTNVEQFYKESSLWKPFDVLVKNVNEGENWSWKPAPTDLSEEALNPYLLPNAGALGGETAKSETESSSSTGQIAAMKEVESLDGSVAAEEKKSPVSSGNASVEADTVVNEAAEESTADTVGGATEDVAIDAAESGAGEDEPAPPLLPEEKDTPEDPSVVLVDGEEVPGENPDELPENEKQEVIKTFRPKAPEKKISEAELEALKALGK